MKFTIRNLRIWLGIALVTWAASAFGADRITTTITFTNQPADGNTFTFNAAARTFRTSVSTPATEIGIGASFAGTATNMYFQVAAFPYGGGVIVSQTATNEIQLLGAVGQSITASLVGTWGTISFSTQTVATANAIRVPFSVEATASVRTNNAAQLITDLNTYSTTKLSSTATISQNLLNLDQTQAATGAKTFLSVTTSNLVNVGTAVSSVGSVSTSEQFGTAGAASAPLALAVGQHTTASGTNSAAFGAYATAANTSSLAIGNFAQVTTLNGTALGANSQASGEAALAAGESAFATAARAVAIGQGSTAGNADSIAIGTGSSTTTTKQIRLGDSTYNVSVPGTLTGTINASTITNGTYRGAQTVTSSVQFTRANISSLANGNNAAVDFGSETVFAKIKAGPTGAFTVNGIAGGTNGRMLILFNSTGQNMTVAHESGVEPTAANRIQTMTGADVTGTANSAAELIYDSETSRWLLINHEP